MAYGKGGESTNRCKRASLQSADLQAEEEEAHTVAGHTHAQSVSETGSPPSWSWTHLARRWRLHGCSGGRGRDCLTTVLGSPGSEVADFIRVLQPVVKEDDVRRLGEV